MLLRLVFLVFFVLEWQYYEFVKDIDVPDPSRTRPRFGLALRKVGDFFPSATY